MIIRMLKNISHHESGVKKYLFIVFKCFIYGFLLDLFLQFLW